LNEPHRVNTLLVAPSSGAPMDARLVQTALKPAMTLDDFGLRISVTDSKDTILVESSRGVLADAIVSAVESASARESLRATQVLTWLATRMTVSGRTVPYSLVSAIGPDAAGDAALSRSIAPARIVLGEWAAEQLRANAGDALDLEYLRWADEGRLVTDHASFRVAGRVPMTGLAADRRLAPEYPGITDSASLANWDPPFPIDLKLVRPVDEDYWKRFRTTPKAFLALDDGQRLWRTRQGQVTSIRLTGLAPGADAQAVARSVQAALEQTIDPVQAGFTVVDVGSQSQGASAGTTDFGAYFSYFSFFLVVSALLLTALFFRLSVEQRLSEIGVLRASGFSLSAIRRLLILEGAVIAGAGALLGIALAIGWAGVMVYGLRTWWVDAVGTTLLRLHVDAMSLAAGAAGGALAAIGSIALTVRGLNRLTPRTLITGSSPQPSVRAAGRRGGMLAAALLVLALALSGLAWAKIVPAAGGFFGAGALVLLGGLKKISDWLNVDAGSRFRSSKSTAGANFRRLAVANASWRPGRSLTSAGLVAAAVFLLVSVDTFRKGDDASGDRHSGTGGFALLAESALPIIYNPATPDGRKALGLDVDAIAARLRPGDDASCLNLYQPRRPRIVGVPDALIDSARFRFAGSIASTDADRGNPWRLLNATSADDVVPAIADATSLEYALHASVGDVITVDADSGRPIRLRIVASLDDSMLQGELLISERAFRQLFPDIAGYRILFIDTAAAPVGDVIRHVQDRLEPYGIDVERSVQRLAAYHRVENTYLSTFQALGGLGLVLGCFGLAAVTARNVLERRREFALLGASGFTGADLQRLVIAEQLFVVLAGVAVGLAAAAVATVPILAARGGVLHAGPMAWVALVLVAGLVTAMAATRQVRRLPLVASLRGS